MNQQNDIIESLQERIRHYEQFSADQEEIKASKEKEVCFPFPLFSLFLVSTAQ